MANNKDAMEVVFENLAYAASIVRFLKMLEKDEQEETVPEEFDVEEILKEAGECE